MAFRCDNHKPGVCDHFKPVCRKGHAKIPGKPCKPCDWASKERSIKKVGRNNWDRDYPEKAKKYRADFNKKHPGRRSAQRLIRYYRLKKDPTEQQIKRLLELTKKYPPLRPLDWGIDLAYVDITAPRGKFGLDRRDDERN